MPRKRLIRWPTSSIVRVVKLIRRDAEELDDPVAEVVAIKQDEHHQDHHEGADRGDLQVGPDGLLAAALERTDARRSRPSGTLDGAMDGFGFPSSPGAFPVAGSWSSLLVTFSPSSLIFDRVDSSSGRQISLI